jgi:ubiquinol oxidase
LTMEALGGDERWVDRFLAQHIAVAYYFMTVFMYLISPRMAYHFSECVEKHAFHSYDDFIKQHGGKLSIGLSRDTLETSFLGLCSEIV